MNNYSNLDKISNTTSRNYGLSVVICCHNSSTRLPKTLECLSNQIVDVDVAWEIVIVNNASTDDTSHVAKECWKNIRVAPLRIIEEPKAGLMYARLTGIIEAKYNTIGFIDDDNWVDVNWVNIAVRILTLHPNIGACGGFNEPVTELPRPFWFEKYSRSYAVGRQELSSGNSTNKKGVVFGAGMLLNKFAIMQLINSGFKPLLIGRQGNKLTCGEDYEICLSLRLAGWEVWYDDRLRIQHFISSERLTWDYLKNIYRVVGYSSLGLDPYYYALSNRNFNIKWLPRWQVAAVKSLLSIAKGLIFYILSRLINFEGDSRLLIMEKELGRLQALLLSRNSYDRNFVNISVAPWANQPHNNYINEH